ncbi:MULTISPECIES: LysR family transcriptional regulator [unclassified Burkholderia]|uniref:LysR family transcriptional regulator n=1 Tax=unclassified Burkholderia TaxID=2613784 RepID=UPI00141D9B0C|nr:MULTISPECIES: LysR family transcriptional regulator [unclassified Burkholderia]NIE84175.1 LysR family transcriptional regulator [Burkholderia sp. Tr-860]NIF63394.1 LysR family transcriptional regulator [Burkholderia sp. Cy-647]NIF69918.1 LysR family transcriptional regulator [Burkholderia sp. Ap-962]NIF95325.1 LysR family transcriptional regulator [Burkholderia sp. Ax-1720]
MNDKLSVLRLFTRVARMGSFTKAGRDLGISQPSVSRQISELEAEVGAALFVRSTRAVKLTDTGADYLSRVDAILEALDEADRVARGTSELRGHLRIALSTSFGVREVIPRLDRFMADHPALRIDLRMADDRQDLIVEGVDLAFRFGTLSDSNATSRLIGCSPRMLVAAPAYLARAGTPRDPAELERHAFVLGPSSAESLGATFRKDGQAMTFRADGRLSTSVNEAATAAAVAGLGLLTIGSWGCRAELADGRLVPLLTDWQLDPVEVHAVFPAGRAARPAARLLVDYLVAELAPISTAPRRAG